MNKSIGELVANAVIITTEDGFELEQWENGVLFVRAPNGEGTQVPDKKVKEAFIKLFHENF